jgi:hypothetical protein
LASELVSETALILSEVMTFEFEKWWNEDKPWYSEAVTEIGSVARQHTYWLLNNFGARYEGYPDLKRLGLPPRFSNLIK